MQRDLIRDSKTLTARQRTSAALLVARVAHYQVLGAASVVEIEQRGIQTATFLAMRRAVCLLPAVDLLLVDGRFVIPSVAVTQRAIVGGDAAQAEIAAASIVAKVARDRWMAAQARRYPQYSFERHVGYGTRLHRQRISEHGICSLHRRNFAPIRNFLTASASASG